MRRPHHLIYTPMLVIAIGNFAGSLLTNAANLLHRGYPDRSTMIGFYKVVSIGGKEADVTLQEILKSTGSSQGTVQAQTSSSLQAVLHDLRLHEKFLQAGLSDQPDLPLGIVVLTDWTESGSELLYPLLNKLREQLVREPGSFLYLLCKIATFEGDPESNLTRARLHLHFENWRTFAQNIGLGFQIYLFDGLKEGFLEASNDHEIEVLMQNFLLALLSGRLAQRLAQTYALADEGTGDVHFNSAGVTALIYDPVALQGKCATQLALEVLESEYLANVGADPVHPAGGVAGILDLTKAIPTWAEDLCAGTPFRVTGTGSINLDLHFSDLEFEDLPPQEWSDAILGYGEYFQEEMQSIHLETLQANASRMIETVRETFEARLRALPASPSLYPGGLSMADQVIQSCIQEISQHLQLCQPIPDESDTLAQMEKDYVTLIENLDRAIEELPEPPRWVRRLPGKFATYAKMLFDFIFLRVEYARLVQLREQIVKALESRFLFQFEQRLKNSIVELCSQLLFLLQTTAAELNALHAKLQQVKDDLKSQDPKLVLHYSPFRVELITPALLRTAHTRRGREASEIRAELLENGLLDDWRNLSADQFRDVLVSACSRAYHSLHEISAETILKEVEVTELSTFSFHSDSGLSASLTLWSQAAVPALRPNFDFTGENRSFSSRYFLCADPSESDILNLLHSSSHEHWEWQVVATGDQYTVMFCKVRQLIPMHALSHLLELARTAFEGLNEQERRALWEAFRRECS